MSTPQNTLQNRVAVVTGASAGIGRAIALALAEAGASVVVNARREERLKALVAEIGDKARGVTGDAADHAVIERLLDTGPDHFGKPVDLVVVNAGRGLAGSVTTSDTSEWEEMVRTNLIGAARLMKEAANRMLEDGPDPADGDAWTKSPRDIVVIGSTVGRHISPFSSMYGSTKFAVNSLAEAQRRELSPKGIRVTLIEPAVVVSEFQSVAGYTDELVGSFKDRFGPLLDPEDVARVVRFVTEQPASVHINDVMIRSTRQDYP